MEPSDVKYIVIHCSATKAKSNVTLEDIDKWHRARGWNMVGYHYVIERDGATRGGRPLSVMGAHTKGHNRNSWGVCLVGGLDESGKPENNFTEAQMSALFAIIAALKVKAPHAEVLGHRDLSPDIDGDGIIKRHEWVKDCPCFDVREWYSVVKDFVA